MKYVIGIDLGTSAVKTLLVNKSGEVCLEQTIAYPLIQRKSGYSEQDPEMWVSKTVNALKGLLSKFDGNIEDIEGISFSGQMHGLVLLDQEGNVLRDSILWNDTRTTKQCQEIYNKVGREKLLTVTKNPALEGFTLPKLLWVKENEPELFKNASIFLLPKDYLRYRMTGHLATDYSDAAGTLLLNVKEKKWSMEICDDIGIASSLCPPLVESHECIGSLTPSFASESGLSQSTRVFAGGADNACGAIGSGILKRGETLCSIGTSGVILSYEDNADSDFEGRVHYFNHGKKDSFYTMGVTLSAGYSLTWFKEVFAREYNFEDLLDGIDTVPAGSNGLLFTPYLTGERTPYADSVIRGSFIGMDASHNIKDFVRAILEGITFSLNESIQIFRDNGNVIDTIISIGGGAKNDEWLQMQADIFDANIVRLKSEQGPGVGAAMLAAVGVEWFATLEECAEVFIERMKEFKPKEANVQKYQKLFSIYQQVYSKTKSLNLELKAYRT
ncbi:xylulokinase [Terribacillus saccharophilus]|uniref:Xylulose kinase n=1 Tax=Terribacillus saccharophilus TaxID=361277 RepID=A0A268H851_9BACI|nr:xylulokinase [Terribacillus saccharophilus]PAE06055.1 xylulokinase [Terribacillus saccharophilus]